MFCLTLITFLPKKKDAIPKHKANIKLGWEPKTNLEELVSEMIKNDKELAKKEALLIKKGFKLSIPKE